MGIFSGRKRSTRELIGAKTFTRFGLETTKGELVIFEVAPTNISVLSPASIELKILRLQHLFQTLPDIELICCDSCECFDANKAYVASRLEEENNPNVRTVLKKELEFFDSIQTELSTARQFMFTFRLKSKKPEQQLEAVNRVEKCISDQGFEIHRMEKPQLKRMLAVYFGASNDGDAIPDFDGEQYLMEESDDED